MFKKIVNTSLNAHKKLHKEGTRKKRKINNNNSISFDLQNRHFKPKVIREKHEIVIKQIEDDLMIKPYEQLHDEKLKDKSSDASTVYKFLFYKILFHRSMR